MDKPVQKSRIKGKKNRRRSSKMMKQYFFYFYFVRGCPLSVKVDG